MKLKIIQAQQMFASMNLEISRIIYYYLVLLVFIMSSCVNENSTPKSLVMNRDLNINILILDRRDYQEKFMPFVKMLTIPMFDSLVHIMKQKDKSETESKIKKESTFLFDDIYEGKMQKLEKDAFFEVSEMYLDSATDSAFRKEISVDVLQPILFYFSSKYFKDKFYCDLSFNPPIEISDVFAPLFAEYSNDHSDLLTQTNIFFPLGNDIAELGGIHYFEIKTKILKDIKQLLSNKRNKMTYPKLMQNILFLEEVLNKGIDNEIMVLMRTTP